MSLPTNTSGRKPSPIVWSMARALGDSEWAQLKAFSDVYGKGSSKWRLLELLRSMKEYDPKAERAAFAANNIYALRFAAKAWLIRTCSRLAFYQPELTEATLEVDVPLRLGMLGETLDLISNAKKIATEEEQFDWKMILLQKEVDAVRLHLQGPEKLEVESNLHDEIDATARMLQLQAEVMRATFEFVERPKSYFRSKMQPDLEASHAYFESEFFMRSVDGWPLRFQIEKLRITEFNHRLLGQISQAANLAEQQLVLIQSRAALHLAMRQAEAQCILRLSGFYATLRNPTGILRLLALVESREPCSEANRPYYFRHYLLLLLHVGFDNEDTSICERALDVIQGNANYFESLKLDREKLTILTLLAAFHLSQNNLLEARRILTQILPFDHLLESMSMRSAMRIMHLFILLEDRDEIGLESFGRRYYRALDKTSNEETRVRKLIAQLSNTGNLENDRALESCFELLATTFDQLSSGTTTTLRPFTFPMMLWVRHKMASFQ